jgi:hypothetical protein
MGIIHKNHHDNHGGVSSFYDTHPTPILRFQMGFLYAKFWNSFLEACTWLEISVLKGFFEICFNCVLFLVWLVSFSGTLEEREI